jgi:hypothetical protein
VTVPVTTGITLEPASEPAPCVHPAARIQPRAWHPEQDECRDCGATHEQGQDWPSLPEPIPGEQPYREGEPNRAPLRRAFLAAFHSVERAREVISGVRWRDGDKFWSYDLYGMFVGVETDGYMHS